MMCKLGVHYISPFVGRWDDIDVDGSKLLYEVRHMIDMYDYKTELLAASLRTVRNLHDAILAGADVATVSAKVLEKLALNILLPAVLIVGVAIILFWLCNASAKSQNTRLETKSKIPLIGQS